MDVCVMLNMVEAKGEAPRNLENFLQAPALLLSSSGTGLGSNNPSCKAASCQVSKSIANTNTSVHTNCLTRQGVYFLLP